MKHLIWLIFIKYIFHLPKYFIKKSIYFSYYTCLTTNFPYLLLTFLRHNHFSVFGLQRNRRTTPRDRLVVYAPITCTAVVTCFKVANREPDISTCRTQVAWRLRGGGRTDESRDKPTLKAPGEGRKTRRTVGQCLPSFVLISPLHSTEGKLSNMRHTVLVIYQPPCFCM